MLTSRFSRLGSIFMYLPSLQAVNNAELYQIGDVTVDPSAVIGIGVILQAAPNCRITIGAGACLGMGTIVNACQGTIKIEPGAVLGAGVLIVGQGQVGANASIGAVSTIFNTSIEPMQVLPAGSVMGDIGEKVLPPSRMSPTDHESPVKAETVQSPTVEPPDSPIPSQQSPSSQSSVIPPVEQPQSSPESQQSAPSEPVGVTNNDASPLTTEAPENLDRKPIAEDSENLDTTESLSNGNSTEELSEDRPLENPSNAESSSRSGNPIYGQVYISRMLGTIFPQGQSINRRPENNS